MHLNIHHRRTDSVHRPGDRTRVGIEQGIVAGWKILYWGRISLRLVFPSIGFRLIQRCRTDRSSINISSFQVHNA